MTPDDITGVEFETKRKGVDDAAVTAHLRSVADTVTAVLSDNEALRAEVARLRRELEQSNKATATELSDDELRDRLDDEAVKRIEESRAEASKMRAEAEADSRRILAEAEAVFAERSMAADEEAARVRAAAKEALIDERADADADAERLVAEAQVVRRQILEDLARRRSLARRQIEQLRAGRERLIASHDVLRRSLDELSTELSLSMSEARAAAETAGHSARETTIEDLEAEIETARLSGLLDTGPVPIITSDEDETPTAEPHDPVAADPTVADLFERMRSDQKPVEADRSSRTRDSLPQR